MATPVYKMFLITPQPSYYALSKDAQDKLLEEVNKLLEAVGGRRLVMCNSTWSNEEWAFFGVEEFPDVEAVQRHSQLLAERGWPFQFAKSFSILGTKTT